MDEFKKFSWRRRLKSFGFAFEGFYHFFRREHNAWIHAAATVLVFIVAFKVNVSKSELIALIFAVALVWLTEMFNTAIEKLLDHLSPDLHPDVKIIKDVAAAAVLTASLAALAVGLIIFIPKFL